MIPDLNLQPTLIDAHNPDDLAWVYQADPGTQPQGIDLDDLPVEVDWSRKRMVWLMYGSCHLGTIESVMHRITDCSHLLVVEARMPDAYHLAPEERERLLAWVGNERLSIVVGGSLMQRAERAVQFIDINRFDGWKPLLSRHEMDTHPLPTRQLFEKLGAGLNIKIMSKGTYLTVAQSCLRNMLVNAPLASTSGFLKALTNSRKDRPVLLVSAGPSLNKQLPLLAENQDLFTIVAVNTVWPILEKHGIVPDALLALDRNSKPAWTVNSVSHQTAFCVDLGCAPGLVWSHDHNHVFTTCDPTIAQVLAPLGISAEYLRTGGSVATSAFTLAVRMGANPIVLIGQDLALTDGKDHAEGYPHTYQPSVLKLRTDKGFDVDGYHGGRVRTERQLMYYKTWFEGQIAGMPDRLVINATEGGARIAGALQLPFAAVCEEIRATSLRKTTLVPSFKTQIDGAHMARLADGLDRLAQDIQAFKKLAEEARKLRRAMGSRPSKKQLARLDNINQRIKDQEPCSKKMVDIMGLAKFEAIRYKTHTAEDMHGMKDALAQYEAVYQTIISGADAALKLLDKTRSFYAVVAERGEIAADLLPLMQDE